MELWVVGVQQLRLDVDDTHHVLARADDLNASIAVLLTDLDGAFGAPPRLPVLWATPAPSAPDPPFGRVLLLGT